uniref:AAA family ATPase n=1 Tax=Gracilinema caldarium TaxID=215591 RepID=A0A7C3IGC2_9SPIR
MRLIHYLEIENFKSIGEKQRIDLDHPSVLIGPNNCGKTSVIQALALWSLAVKTWYKEIMASKKAKKRGSIPLNRLDIVAVPVQKTRFFWRDAKVRTGNEPIPITITAGIEYEGNVMPLSLRFRNDGDDIVYCSPEEDIIKNVGLLEYAASLDINILYCMSGLETDEAIVKPNRIDYYLGKGQTAQVLRNLCLMVYQNTPEDWVEIQKLINRLFHVTLGIPKENSRGAIDLYYEQDNGKEPFEIASAGRGFQEMLLIFAYLFSHKKSVLLIDEPDAHLEILRQKQVYILLRDIALKNQSQVIMVTHSEVLLEEALSTNLTLMLDGKVENLTNKSAIKESLTVYGSNHYVRARERGYVFYIEGSTDIDILRGLAEKMQHPVAKIWDERINSFYVQNNYPEQDTGTELERVEGCFGLNPKEHFNTLRKLIKGLKGLAILDNDGKGKQDWYDGDLKITYWKRYEIENYFITPDILLKYVESRKDDMGLFAPDNQKARDVIRKLILTDVFTNNEKDMLTWEQATPDAARLIWESKTDRIKMSLFAEKFFKQFAEETGQQVLMKKGDFYTLVNFLDVSTIPDEVSEKLNLLKEIFENARPILNG